MGIDDGQKWTQHTALGGVSIKCQSGGAVFTKPYRLRMVCKEVLDPGASGKGKSSVGSLSAIVDKCILLNDIGSSKWVKTV